MVYLSKSNFKPFSWIECVSVGIIRFHISTRLGFRSWKFVDFGIAISQKLSKVVSGQTLSTYRSSSVICMATLRDRSSKPAFSGAFGSYRNDFGRPRGDPTAKIASTDPHLVKGSVESHRPHLSSTALVQFRQWQERVGGKINNLVWPNTLFFVAMS